MFAVVKTGGKQYRVAPNEMISVEKIDAEAGSTVTLSDVLLCGSGDTITVGAPLVAGASVVAEIVEQRKGEKVKVFKKTRRSTYRRKKGHRQFETVLLVKEIVASGMTAAAAKPAKAAKPKAEKVAGGDDLKLIGGVGPALETKLAKAGFTTFKQIADLDDAGLEALGETVGFPGRPAREEWGIQARELMAGGTPRAKVDQDAAAKSSDSSDA